MCESSFVGKAILRDRSGICSGAASGENIDQPASLQDGSLVVFCEDSIRKTSEKLSCLFELNVKHELKQQATIS